MPHPIENIMKTSIEQIRQIVDVNTIIGDPIFVENANMILPVSKVTLGLLSGGGEYPPCKRPVERANDEMGENPERFAFAGSSAAGMSIVPMAFLSVSKDSVKLLPVQYDNVADRQADVIPQIIVNVCRAFGCKDSDKGEDEGR